MIAIDTLTIQHFRGIRDLTLNLAGKNLVVWGPNGTGKSGVIDAIDFLLSGEVSRLAGAGSGELSLARHGAHVDADVGQARVEAVVRLTEGGAPVTVGRWVKSPQEIQCSDPAAFPTLQRVFSLADKRQHLLTRRDILRFIAVTPGDRAKQIEELLDLGDVGTARRELRTVANELATAAEQAAKAVTNERARAVMAIGAASPETVLAQVNAQRGVLGLGALAELEPGKILSGTDAELPSARIPGRTLPTDLARLSELARAFESTVVGDRYQTLRVLLDEISTDTARTALAQARLIEEGIALQGDSSLCPLCDAKWDDAAALSAHLQTKLRLVEEVQALNSRLEASASSLDALLRPLASVLEVMAPALSGSNNEHAPAVVLLGTQIRSLLTALPLLTRRFELAPLPPILIDREELIAFVTRLVRSVPDAPADPAAQRHRARELLTRFDERLTSLRTEEVNARRAQAARHAARSLYDAFVAARDAALNALYESVRDRFVTLYQSLHESETTGFTAALSPTATGMRFEVDFFERGSFPPTAVHSEGHQDSMGLCLFLALAEKLAGGAPPILLLDDVVMSVDHEHRRDVCHLLREQFAATQLVITTHDRTWASQLKALKVVENQNLVEFPSWTIESGPATAVGRDLWASIEAHIASADVPSAAAALRRGCEEFFESACDGLRAKVGYRSNYRWEFGDWVPSAMERYKELLARARSSARSWSDEARLAQMDEIESIRKQVWARVWDEAWAINPNVHFNQWVALSPPEFESVAQAYRDLMALFRCANCNGLLEVAYAEDQPAQLSCRCGQQSWNLRMQV